MYFVEIGIKVWLIPIEQGVKTTTMWTILQDLFFLQYLTMHKKENIVSIPMINTCFFLSQQLN